MIVHLLPSADVRRGDHLVALDDGSPCPTQIVHTTTTDEGIRVAGIVGSAVLAALISAARRAIPGFMVWVREKLGTTDAGA